MKINSMIAGLCLLLLAGFSGCDNWDRKGEITNDITVNVHSLNLFVGETAQLAASPANLSFTWKSEDTEIATVDAKGLVTAVGDGATFIIATAGDAVRRVPIASVTKIPLKGFSLSISSLSINPKIRRMAVPVLVPGNANDASAPIWTSTNTEVASVDYKGEITGVGGGETDVVCTINGMKQTVKVEVWLTKPFKGPHTLSAAAPCTLPAVDFDFGGEGNAYHDNDTGNSGGNAYRNNGGDANGGGVDIGGDLSVGWTGGGEWLIYTIEVANAGNYKVEMDGAGDGTGSSQIRLELLEGFENHVTGYWGNWTNKVVFNFPNTGGWGNWAWYALPNTVSFPQGKHKLRFYWVSASSNLRNLRFTYQP